MKTKPSSVLLTGGNMHYSQNSVEDDRVNPSSTDSLGRRSMTPGDFERFTAGLTAGVERFESRLKGSCPLRETGIEISVVLPLRSLESWMMDYNISPDRENALYAKAYGVFLAVVQASRDQAAATHFGREHDFPSARQYAADLRSDWAAYIYRGGNVSYQDAFLKDYAEWL